MSTKKKGLLAAAGGAGEAESGPFILSGIDQSQTPVAHAWSGNSISMGQGLWFNPDGTKMWIYGNTGSSGDYIYEYELSTAWDTRTYTYAGNQYVTSSTPTERAIFWNNDGTYFYYNYGYFTSYKKWGEVDISNAFDMQNNSGIQSGIDNVAWFYVKPDDGTRTWHTNFGSYLYTNSNSTAWSPVTTEYSNNYVDIGYTFNKFQFADSGSMLFIYDDDNDALVRYTMSTAWDISTLTFKERVAISDMKTGSFNCFFVSTNGDYLFYTNASNVLRRISFE